jgi:hypothetical protein
VRKKCKWFCPVKNIVQLPVQVSFTIYCEFWNYWIIKVYAQPFFTLFYLHIKYFIGKIAEWVLQHQVRLPPPCFFGPGAGHLLVLGAWRVSLVWQRPRFPAVGFAQVKRVVCGQPVGFRSPQIITKVQVGEGRPFLITG